MKNNVKNERIKRRFYRWLKEAKGYAESSIRGIEKAIRLYEDFAKHEDFALFNPKKAIGFKKWLEDKRTNGKALSNAAQYHYLRHLKGFFGYLSTQVGYKSKITPDSISYLSLEKKKVREAISPKNVDYPSLEYVKQLTNSIEVRNEIDRRDRALIAFLLLSCMRDKAITTLPIGCFNRAKLQIRQFARDGVETKFGKSYISCLIPFDSELVAYVIDWVEYLEKVKLFGSKSPLFPRSKREQIEGGLTFICREVEPIFWKGTGSVRQILRDRAEAAGLKYYHPHSFRHLAAYLAVKNCHNGEQLRAISQNFGHENIGTTMMTYGKLDEFRMGEVIANMDFSGKPPDIDNAETIEKIRNLINNQK